MRPNRRTLHALAVVALVAGLAACGNDEPPEPDSIGSPAPDATDDPADEDAPDEDAAAPDDDAAAPDDASTGDEDPEPDPAEEPDGAEPLTGEPSTEPADEDPTAGVLAVTDVRVASHDGFDRLVFDIDDADGTGTVGWMIRYVDTPTSQGSGDEVEVDGTAYLSVSIAGVTLPPELPPGVEAYTEDTDGPPGGAITEVVHDSIFEGYHQFFVGLDEQRPYVVQRLSDPQRVVIDLFAP